MRKLLCLCACALALAAAPPDGVSERNLRADLGFLCSDALAGRESLAPGAAVAAQYIAAAFERAGLAPASHGSYLQNFPLVAYEPDRAHIALSVNGKSLRYGKDFLGAFPRDVTIRGSVVFAGYGITAPEYGYDDYAGLDVRGKIVLIFDHEPQERNPKSEFNGVGQTRYGQTRVKVENAYRHGAAAVLLLSEPLRQHRGAFDPLPRTADGHSARATAPRQAIADPTAIPLIAVSDDTGKRLLAVTGKTPAAFQTEIDSGPMPASQPLRDTEMVLKTVARDVRPGTSANVAGLLPGTGELAKETVIVSAHYDHLGVRHGEVYRGANDNASGTVAVMELARMFAASGVRPKRSVLFIVFGSEEEGLLGSFYYTAHPLLPLETTRAVVNLDMIARDEAHIPQSRGVLEIPADTTNELNLVGTYYSPDLRQALVDANRHTRLELSTKFDRDHDLNVLYRCDHFPFLASGVPAVWLFGGFHPGYHEPVDTVDRLDFPKLEKVVQLAYWTVTSIASGERTPHFSPAGRD